MKPGENIKHYVSYFQIQMALVYTCNDDMVIAAFSGLQASYFFYKHLVKYEVTWMRDILSQAKRYGVKPTTLPNEGMKGRYRN